MEKRTIKGVFFVSAVLILNAIIFFWGRIKSTDNIQLLYGQKIRNFSVVDVDGTNVDIRQNEEEWKLVYLSPLLTSESRRNVRYLDMLNQRFNDSRLKVVGIFNTIIEDIVDFKYKAQISFKVINYAENEVLKKILPLPGESNLILFLNPSNKIKFVSSFFLQNDIRQIVEKALYGKISYAPMETFDTLKIGNRFQNMKVRDIKKGTFTDFPGKKDVYAIIFTGRCADCLLSNFKSSYSLLDEKLKSLNSEISFIFSSKFLEDDILHNFKNSIFNLFIAVDSIPQIEDYFNSIFYVDDQIIIIKINSEGAIVSFDSLENFIKSRRSTSIDSKT